eukprot:3941821-Rhodomonas_salina.1
MEAARKAVRELQDALQVPPRNQMRFCTVAVHFVPDVLSFVADFAPGSTAKSNAVAPRNQMRFCTVAVHFAPDMLSFVFDFAMLSAVCYESLCLSAMCIPVPMCYACLSRSEALSFSIFFPMCVWWHLPYLGTYASTDVLVLWCQAARMEGMGRKGRGEEREGSEKSGDESTARGRSHHVPLLFAAKSNANDHSAGTNCTEKAFDLAAKSNTSNCHLYRKGSCVYLISQCTIAAPMLGVRIKALSELEAAKVLCYLPTALLRDVRTNTAYSCISLWPGYAMS